MRCGLAPPPSYVPPRAARPPLPAALPPSRSPAFRMKGVRGRAARARGAVWGVQSWGGADGKRGRCAGGGAGRRRCAGAADAAAAAAAEWRRHYLGNPSRCCSCTGFPGCTCPRGSERVRVALSKLSDPALAIRVLAIPAASWGGMERGEGGRARACTRGLGSRRPDAPEPAGPAAALWRPESAAVPHRVVTRGLGRHDVLRRPRVSLER